ncbi:MAG: hypothetical protein IT285_06685 [Bdellovibrionales bacterium]|nr:hypothetical protein [Bdellovibrionales bacterium]
MKTTWIVCALMSLVGSCAFKEPEKDTRSLEGTLIGNTSPYSLAVDWTHETAVLPDKLLKARRSIHGGKQDQFQTAEPLTIPANVPEIVYLGLELPVDRMKEAARFSKVALVIEGRRFEVVSDLLEGHESVPRKWNVILSVSGLSAVLPMARSRAGVLDVELYGQLQRLASVKIPLRTPPSQVEVKTLTLRDLSAQDGASYAPLFTLPLDGDRLQLVQVLRIRNDEAVPIEIRVPRRLGADLAQWENQLTHKDKKCSYAIVQTPSWRQLAQELYALPMDGRLVFEAIQTIQNTDLEGELSVKVAPGATADVGLYGHGDGVDQWMKDGPKGPEFTQVRVDDSCYTVCIKHLCTCTMCEKRVEWFEDAPEHFEANQRVCECDKWETRRRRVNVTVGVNREPVLLRLREGAGSWLVRFDDVDFRKDGESRSLDFLPPQSRVQWF